MADLAECLIALAAHGSRRKAAKALGMAKTTFLERLAGAQEKLTASAPSPHAARLHHELTDGVVLVGSDAHKWPGPHTTAMRGFLWAIRQLRPELIVINGDLFDGATISRWPGIGWETKPTIEDELMACTSLTDDIEQACHWDGQGSQPTRRIWALGNHDMRFETRLAAVAPEYRGIRGIHLKDHFPNWEPAWSVWVNPGTGRSPLVIKHRWKGGIHAVHNNTLSAGMSIATGHLHSLRVSPFSDYWGTRYGVDTGTLARPYGPQFTNYTEDNPVNWRAGFAVFTWSGGRMLMPELAQVWDEEAGVIEFRGELVRV